MMFMMMMMMIMKQHFFICDTIKGMSNTYLKIGVKRALLHVVQHDLISGKQIDRLPKMINIHGNGTVCNQASIKRYKYDKLLDNDKKIALVMFINFLPYLTNYVTH